VADDLGFLPSIELSMADLSVVCSVWSTCMRCTKKRPRKERKGRGVKGKEGEKAVTLRLKCRSRSRFRRARPVSNRQIQILFTTLAFHPRGNYAANWVTNGAGMDFRHPSHILASVKSILVPSSSSKRRRRYSPSALEGLASGIHLVTVGIRCAFTLIT
jgi:hypothetical protein